MKIRNWKLEIAPSMSEERGRSERFQATVYQKHRSLLKRKLMYRGWCLASVRTLRGGVQAPNLSADERRR